MEKTEKLKKLSNSEGVIAALAIDQRKSVRKPIAALRGVAPEQVTDEMLSEFKACISRVLSPHATAVLIDPEYGMDAVRAASPGTGLLLTYEMDGFENPRPNRMLALLPDMSALRMKELGASGVKILLSYTPFDDAEVNDRKHALIERIGMECAGAGLAFFLEFIGYDAAGGDEGGLEYARRKPEIVIQSMREFSKDRYCVDVMKVQVPLNAEFLEGSCSYKGVTAYTKQQGMEILRRCGEVAGRPFIFLSAAVGIEEFVESLGMALESDSRFSGVLCGRATWRGGIPVYAAHGRAALEDWLSTQGVANIKRVNESVRGATPWWAYATSSVLKS